MLSCGNTNTTIVIINNNDNDDNGYGYYADFVEEKQYQYQELYKQIYQNPRQRFRSQAQINSDNFKNKLNLIKMKIHMMQVNDQTQFNLEKMEEGEGEGSIYEFDDDDSKKPLIIKNEVMDRFTPFRISNDELCKKFLLNILQCIHSIICLQIPSFTSYTIINYSLLYIPFLKSKTEKPLQL